MNKVINPRPFKFQAVTENFMYKIKSRSDMRQATCSRHETTYPPTQKKASHSGCVRGNRIGRKKTISGNFIWQVVLLKVVKARVRSSLSNLISHEFHAHTLSLFHIFLLLSLSWTDGEEPSAKSTNQILWSAAHIANTAESLDPSPTLHLNLTNLQRLYSVQRQRRFQIRKITPFIPQFCQLS